MMDFRSLALSGIAATVVSGGATRGAEEKPSRQVLELRTYHFASEEKLEVFSDYLETSLIPGLNRAGVSPVGVFRAFKDDNPKVKFKANDLKLYVLLPHADLDSALSLPGRLDADTEVAAAIRAVLGPEQGGPVYKRFESQLMLAFAQCPRVEVPTKSADRVLQLRIYESHNHDRALRKIEMFNEGGEIEIFRRNGMNPVFFGQSTAGTRLPNLTYMLGFDTPDAQEAAWAAFLKDPAWTKLKRDPKYAKTVSQITNYVLRPVAGSQI